MNENEISTELQKVARLAAIQGIRLDNVEKRTRELTGVVASLVEGSPDPDSLEARTERGESTAPSYSWRSSWRYSSRFAFALLVSAAFTSSVFALDFWLLRLLHVIR